MVSLSFTQCFCCLISLQSLPSGYLAFHSVFLLLDFSPIFAMWLACPSLSVVVARFLSNFRYLVILPFTQCFCCSFSSSIPGGLFCFSRCVVGCACRSCNMEGRIATLPESLLLIVDSAMAGSEMHLCLLVLPENS